MSMSLSVTNPCIRLNDMPTRSVKDLKPGMSGWTQAWAMWKDDAGRFWLRQNYSLYDEKSIGIEMLVTVKDDGVIVVDTSNVHNHLWETESPGLAEACSIPITTVHTKRNPSYL